MSNIFQDPLKLTVFAILMGLELVSVIFLVVRFIKDNKEAKEQEDEDG